MQSLVAGLRDVVPILPLRLLSGDELEFRVCGQPRLDIDLLRRHTEYGRGIAPGSRLAETFWSVLGAMSTDEQAMVLRFTYARTKLPTKDATFGRPFRLQLMEPGPGTSADDCLPVAHTCVFQLNLPPYSSADVMHRQLVRASTLCVGYDLDDVRAAGSFLDDQDDEPAFAL